MSEPHLYSVAARWTGAKEGILESSDGLPPLLVSSPPQFGGPAGVWSPEHLLVAATASCTMTTFLVVAELSNLPVLALEVAGEGTLERADDRRYRFTRVVLRPRVTIEREEDRDKALRLLDKAHGACLISRSLSAEVTMEPVVEVGHPSAAG